MSDEDVAYVLTLDLPDLPKGEQVQIVGLGTFENGSTYEVTNAEAEQYRILNSFQEPKIDEETQAFLGSELVKGPTLLQAAKGMHGVSVETKNADEKKAEAEAARKAEEEAAAAQAAAEADALEGSDN